MRPAGITRLLPALAILVAACTAAGTPGPSGSGSGSGSGTSVATPSDSASPTVSRAPGLPEDVPSGFADDVPASDVPPEALVPPKGDPTGVWIAETTEGEAIVVAWVIPGGDPFRRAGGFAEWRRFAGTTPPWRPVAGDAHTAEDRVLGTRAVTADVTGDGSDDAIVTEETGGSGACTRRTVLDLATGSVVWRRQLCDADVNPSSDPVGLSLVEAVFRPGDSHCCPSRIRTTVLTYDGERWTKASVNVDRT